MLTGDQVKNIGLSGVACAHATLYVHPMETAMVQQQLIKKGTKLPSWPVMMIHLNKTEGLVGLYRGLSASLLRELSYSSLRFGLYEPIRDKFAEIGPTNNSGYRMATRVASGCSAGGLAAVIACPFELLKVRAQGYPTRPPPLSGLIRQVGGSPFKVAKFYEGMGTIVARAMVLGATKMVCYNEVKDMLKKVPNHPDPRKRASSIQSKFGLIHSWADSDYVKYGHTNEPSTVARSGLVFITAFITGLVVTCTTSPLTNARTVIMTSPGKFSGMLDAMNHIRTTHGLLGFYRGWGAQWARFGPYACIQFLTWEQLRYSFNIKPI